MLTFDQLAAQLKEQSGKKVVIVSHRSPDGDSIGSSLGLYHFLKSLNYKVTVATPDPAPAFLSWLEGFDQIVNFEKHREETLTAIAEANYIFCLDFNTLVRSASLEQPIRKNKEAVWVNLDHHQEPDDFADYQWSDITASSTAEIVYQFVEQVLGKAFENEAYANCIYTGILTDTGSFRFSSTSAKTHRIAADLVEFGADPTFIHSQVYDSYSPDRLKLLGFALHEKLTLLPQFHTAIIALTEKDLQRFNFQKGDTEGLVNFPLSIKEVNMAILITEKDGKVKMSFRSKGNFAVNQLSGRYFNGGGHLNAAGGISKVDVPKTVEQIVEILPEYEAELNF
ncbi:MAG: bifunctional oligoribonuclease/PAP phosphatase NrnA [Vicingaceae bacterium]